MQKMSIQPPTSITPVPLLSDADSVSCEAESVYGTVGATGMLASLFPVFEWDDNLIIDDDADAAQFFEHEIAQLLPAAVREDGGPEVHSVLEAALLAGNRLGLLSPSPPASPRRTPRRLRHSNASGGSSGSNLLLPARVRVPSSIVTQSQNSTISEMLGNSAITPSAINSGGGGPQPNVTGGGPQPVVTGASNTPHSVQSRANPIEPASASNAGGPAAAESDDWSGSLVDTARTLSVYALNESAESHTILGDSLQLDFQQLIALGRSPRQMHSLSNDEARALPRVRFEAPDMQSCSICLENFTHGILLTGLNCGHVFHVDCLAQWVQRSAQCPNCRSPIEPCNGSSEIRNNAVHRGG